MMTRQRYHVFTKLLTAALAAVLTLSLVGTAGCRQEPPVNDPNNSGGGAWSNPSASLGDAPYGPYTAKDGTWAIYWYICGSDIELREDMRYNATGQVLEMMKVTLPDNVTVVIQAGGAKAWHLEGVDPSLLNRLVYRGNSLTLVETQPLASMGEAQTFADFLAFCNLNYPAEHQVLMIYDHGGGSLSGIAFDDLFDMDSLTLPELSSVIQSRPAASGTYELVNLAACLMASIDSVAVFNGYARYLVASEEVTLGCEADFEKLFAAIAANKDVTGAQLGRVIAEGYYEQCQQVGYTAYSTSSTIDMSYADALVAAYDRVGAELLQGAATGGAEFIAAFGRAAYEAENYGALDAPVSKYDMVDIGDLVLKAKDLLPASGDAMLRVLDQALAYHLTNPMRADGWGVSCFYPYSGSERSYQRFAALDTSPAFKFFYEYVQSGSLSAEAQAYLESLSSAAEGPGPEIEPEVLPDPSDLGLDGHSIVAYGNGTWWLELGDSAANVAAIFIEVGLYDSQTGDFVLFGTRSDLYCDWEFGLFRDEFSGWWGSLDGALCYMEAVSKGPGFVFYRVPVYHNGQPRDLMVAYEWDEPYYYQGQYRIIGLINPNPIEDASSPTFVPLTPGDSLEPILYRFSQASGYSTDISGPGEPATRAITVSQNTSFYDIELADGTYMIAFQMIDFSGGRHYSGWGYYQIVDSIMLWATNP